MTSYLLQVFFSSCVSNFLFVCLHVRWVFSWLALVRGRGWGNGTCADMCYRQVATRQAWVLLVSAPPYFGGTGSLTGLGLTRLADQWGPGSTSPLLRLRAHVPMPRFFTWVLGLTFWASCLRGKRFTTWAISSALTCSFYCIILSVGNIFLLSVGTRLRLHIVWSNRLRYFICKSVSTRDLDWIKSVHTRVMNSRQGTGLLLKQCFWW